MILSLMIFCFILHTMWLAECWRYTCMYTKKTTEAERGSAANGFCFGLSFFVSLSLVCLLKNTRVRAFVPVGQDRIRGKRSFFPCLAWHGFFNPFCPTGGTLSYVRQVTGVQNNFVRGETLSVMFNYFLNNYF